MGTFVSLDMVIFEYQLHLATNFMKTFAGIRSPVVWGWVGSTMAVVGSVKGLVLIVAYVWVFVWLGGSQRVDVWKTMDEQYP